LVLDNAGRLWVGHQTGGLRVFRLGNAGFGKPLEADTTIPQDTIVNPQLSDVRILCRSADGHIWGGTNGGGAVEFDGQRFRRYTKAQGLLDNAILALTEDRVGNMWLGANSGLMRLARRGFVTYQEASGLGHQEVISFFEDAAGRLHAISGNWRINRWDGERFTSVRFNLPAHITDAQWRTRRNALQDHLGEWWVATGEGLFRFSKVSRIEELADSPPKAVYTQRDGLLADDVCFLYEDAHGDIWMSTFAPAQETLARWERATGRFYRYGTADGLPPFNCANAFAEDPAGALWIGFRDGGLARFSAGRFTLITAADGLPASGIRNLIRDRVGQVWFGTILDGIGRIDEPTAARPRIKMLTTRDGLSSMFAAPMLMDDTGQMYFGNERGLDRFNATTGQIKHYSPADGLAGGAFFAAHRDRAGTLWFATSRGVSRFLAQPDPPPTPPPVFISRLRIAGIDHPLFALGERELAGLRLEPQQNHLEVDFFGFGDSLRYQTKLEGQAGDWSTASENRAVNLRLSPGGYRLLVRAVNADGVFSQTPASIGFRILRPVWQRWWFVTLLALACTTGLLVFARYRAGRLRALRESEDRFRTLAETASDAIITIDAAGLIVFVNPAVEKVFGHPTGKMIGQDLTMLMPEYLRHLHHKGFARYQQTGQRHISWEAIELPGLHHDGHEIPLEISFGEFTSKGRRLFTGIVRDISERKRAAEALEKAREERLAELEQVRRRIATDLHDDIGSSLTQISILSEVLHQRLRPHTGALNNAGQQQVNEPLRLIATASRELVDSMSDIVWAINPQKDHLSDLARRMLTFASDTFIARNITFDFRAPDEDHDIHLSASLRREVFLIFKETVNNLARHAQCTTVDIEFQINAATLTLITRDNGRGFDVAEHHDGHGLQSMRERATALGGTFEIVSAVEQGTTVKLCVPLNG
jgi:PAS domain S-box-containing protein